MTHSGIHAGGQGIPPILPCESLGGVIRRRKLQTSWDRRFCLSLRRQEWLRYRPIGNALRFNQHVHDARTRRNHREDFFFFVHNDIHEHRSRNRKSFLQF